MGGSLWGEEFTVKKPEVKKVLAKVNNPKDPKVIKRVAKSSALSILDQLALIRTNVEKVLGRYADTTRLITSIEELHNYIDKAIFNGEIDAQ